MRLENWIRSSVSETVRKYVNLDMLSPWLTLILGGFLVCATPLSFIGLWPNFFIIILYIWCLHAPEKLSLGLIAAFGIIHDVHTGIPLGFHSLMYALFYLLVITQRQIIVGRPFIVVWIGFAAFVLLVSGIGSIVSRLFETFPANSFDLQFHIVVTIGILPVFYQMFQPLLPSSHST